MAWGSSVPAALTALVTTLDAGLDVRVLDTTVVSDAATRETVNVGYQSPDQPAVEAQNTPEGYGGSPDRELYTVNCAVRVLKAKDIVTARARAFELFGQAGALIKADPRLGGAVMRASVGVWSMLPQAGQGGALVEILFGVDCDAFTNR